MKVNFDEKTYTLPTEDLHLAIIFYVVDLGTQETRFKKKLRKWSIGFKLAPSAGTWTDEETAETHLLNVYKEFTIYKNISKRSNFYKMLVHLGLINAETEGYYIEDLLGTRCRVFIQHNNEYANIENIIKSDNPNDPVYDEIQDDIPEYVYFSLEKDEWEKSARVWENFSQRRKDTIVSSPEGAAFLEWFATYSKDDTLVDRPGSPKQKVLFTEREKEILNKLIEKTHKELGGAYYEHIKHAYNTLKKLNIEMPRERSDFRNAVKVLVEYAMKDYEDDDLPF